MSLKQYLRQKFADPNQLSLLDLLPSAKVDPEPPRSTVPESPIPPGHRRLRLDDHTLDYRLLRSKRRTIGFLIDDEGLRVTAPRWITVAEIELVITEKRAWIFKKINEQRERSVRRLQPPMEWRDGASLPYLGADIVVRIADAANTGIRFDEQTRELHEPAGVSDRAAIERSRAGLAAS